MQDQILDALRRGAHDEALALARKAVEAEPQSARAQQGLAMALSANADGEGALQAIDRAIALSPDEADFHFQRARLLLDARQLGDAQTALGQTIALDPNQFGAYILQAQLALGRGETDEAERLNRLAARIAPEHPWREMLDGMVSLSRGQDDDALRLLSSAAGKAPDDPQVLMGLALAYMAKGHHAFAEQALRKLLDRNAGHVALRVQLVQILHRQGRMDDALEALKPLLDDPVTATAPTLGLAGELELAAGRPQQALDWLRRALGIDPRNLRVLSIAMTAWQQLGDADDARATLESALATTRDAASLWQARLALEDPSVEGAAGEVVTRWNDAMPAHPAALEAKMRLLQRHGDGAAALDAARAIIEHMPGNAAAQALIVDDLKSRDPQAAVTYVTDLLSKAATEPSKAMLGAWLATLEDAAGQYGAAAARWTELAAQLAPSQLPLPPVSLPTEEVAAGPLPPWEAGDTTELDTLFLWGPPGSCVERVASVMSGIEGFRADRFSPQGVRDGFQSFSSVPKLSLGEIDPAAFVAGWRDGLAARGIEGDRVIDWLVWWDNALLRVLRPQLQKAAVMFVVRDPRDMLLQWLAFGSPMQIGMASVPQAAAWLASLMSRVAELGEQKLYRYALLRIDGIEHDAAGLAGAVSQAFGVEVPAIEQAPGVNLPPGHWRQYADVLAEPFAILAPVAMRLGYPET